MRVPLLDLTRQFAGYRDEAMSEIGRVFETQRFILGEEGAALERELAAFLGAGHAVGVSSGTDALLVALTALDVGPGDEVVVPAFSFFATAGVVSRLGAVPVFADVEPATLTLAPESFEAKVGPRTRAVVPVHLYGQAADLDSILEIARRRGIAVIEDACQAIGARYRGRVVGTFGEIGAFSFFPTKNLGAAGDAGLVTTNDEAIAARLRRLRVHGMEPKYHHAEIGGNFRLDELQAAVLRVKLRRLDGWNRRRAEIAAEYRRRLAGAERAGRIRLPAVGADRDHIYHQFVVRVANRDRVRARLAEAGIGSEVYYPVPLHLQECFLPLGGRPGDLPESERAAGEVLALPIWPELEENEIAAVASSVDEAVA
ncbi:MAG TPA: DegT/DnrJ/EryC1/StrS family aminotransferase [Thermoanaerobaculia bacterium]|nr:DegT/DnrJ/EryC1/StrS family aminotransferase [Thermoanaerobaculia bacterium]